MYDILFAELSTRSSDRCANKVHISLSLMEFVRYLYRSSLEIAAISLWPRIRPRSERTLGPVGVKRLPQVPSGYWRMNNATLSFLPRGCSPHRLRPAALLVARAPVTCPRCLTPFHALCHSFLRSPSSPPPLFSLVSLLLNSSR